MKYLFLFLSTLFLFCKKEPITLQYSPRDAARIEGNWRSLNNSPTKTYHFERGFLIQQVHVGPTPVWSYEFLYATRLDTVFIGGDSINSPRVWTCYFHCDSLVEVAQSNGGLLSQTFFLKREK
jgi:hypothetical protein